jgi:hypothetical protein
MCHIKKERVRIARMYFDKLQRTCRELLCQGTLVNGFRPATVIGSL